MKINLKKKCLFIIVLIVCMIFEFSIYVWNVYVLKWWWEESKGFSKWRGVVIK